MNIFRELLERYSGKKALALILGLGIELYLFELVVALPAAEIAAIAWPCTAVAISVALIVAGYTIGQGIADGLSRPPAPTSETTTDGSSNPGS